MFNRKYKEEVEDLKNQLKLGTLNKELVLLNEKISKEYGEFTETLKQFGDKMEQYEKDSILWCSLKSTLEEIETIGLSKNINAFDIVEILEKSANKIKEG